MKRTEAREKAFKVIYSSLFNEYDETQFSNDENDMWAKKIVDSFKNNRTDLEESISNNLKGYTISRLNKIDLSIIFLALIELNYMKEDPKQIIVNEAVELAKKYSTEKSPRFINGFLAGIIN